MPVGDNLLLTPYFRLDDGSWTLPDIVMSGIWWQWEQEGKVEHLFYDGCIRDLTGWLQFCKRPDLHLVVVADINKRQPVHVAWLKDHNGVTAWGHHCAVGQYKRGAWEKVRDYWSKIDVLHVTLGLTPKSNDLAVRFILNICKWTKVGEIPEACYMAYEGRRVPGILTYYQFRGS